MGAARGCCNFNPPAPCGAGLSHFVTLTLDAAFQSTRPLRGGTFNQLDIRLRGERFQSTRPSRGGTALVIASVCTS